MKQAQKQGHLGNKKAPLVERDAIFIIKLHILFLKKLFNFKGYFSQNIKINFVILSLKGEFGRQALIFRIKWI